MSDYPCAYCNRKMDHRPQPSSTFAQCWECWAMDRLQEIERLRRSTVGCVVAGLCIGFFLGSIVGFEVFG